MRRGDAVGAVYEAAQELSPEDGRNVAGWHRPSWPQEGWLRPEQKVSEYLIAAAGVVDITFIAFYVV
jgi:hypothetical protein